MKWLDECSPSAREKIAILQGQRAWVMREYDRGIMRRNYARRLVARINVKIEREYTAATKGAGA